MLGHYFSPPPYMAQHASICLPVHGSHKLGVPAALPFSFCLSIQVALCLSHLQRCPEPRVTEPLWWQPLSTEGGMKNGRACLSPSICPACMP